MSEKVKKANKIFKHQRKIYLIFFKAYKEEALMLEGMNKSNTKLIKMHRDSLNVFALEGLQKLKKLKTVEGDIDIKAALTDLLFFYVYESGEKSKLIVNYYIKKKKLNKLKDEMEESDDQEKKSAYNEAVVAMVNVAIKHLSGMLNQMSFWIKMFLKGNNILNLQTSNPPLSFQD